MYCQPPEFPYQMSADYQQYTGAVSYQGDSIPQYNGGNISPYSPTAPTDRPSFRIEDILLQSKAAAAAHSYGGVYPPGLQYSTFPTGGLSHGCMNDRDYQGVSNSTVNQLPVYFRLKPNVRTSNGRKCRKPRTVFSELQLMVLEREFGEHKYLSTPQRTKLADRLGLNQTQVKTWYQNRRMKWKKETNEFDTKKLKQNESEDTKTIVEQIQNGRDTDDITCSM